MANEVTYGITVSASSYGIEWKRTGLKADATGKQDARTHSIGTSREAIALSGDLGTPGLALVTNLGPTNYVEIGPNDDDTSYLLRLLVGQSNLISLNGTTIYARANTAGVELKIEAIGRA